MFDNNKFNDECKQMVGNLTQIKQLEHLPIESKNMLSSTIRSMIELNSKYPKSLIELMFCDQFDLDKFEHITRWCQTELNKVKIHNDGLDKINKFYPQNRLQGLHDLVKYLFEMSWI